MDYLKSSAVALAVDDSGFLWVGTQDGLNRFDGYVFNIFRHDPNNLNSLSSHRINSLKIDRKNRLWISTKGGLHVMNNNTGEVRRLSF